MDLLQIIAQAPGGADGAGSGGGGGGGMMMLWYFIPLILIFWLLIFRPQKKERERRKRMIEGLRKNDRVVTIGGIHGVVKKVEDNEIVVAIDAESKDKVRVRMSKSAINAVRTADDEASSDNESPAEIPPPQDTV